MQWACSKLRNSKEQGETGRNRDTCTEVEEKGVNVLHPKTRREDTETPEREAVQSKPKGHERVSCIYEIKVLISSPQSKYDMWGVKHKRMWGQTNCRARFWKPFCGPLGTLFSNINSRQFLRFTTGQALHHALHMHYFIWSSSGPHEVGMRLNHKKFTNTLPFWPTVMEISWFNH